MVPKEPPAAKVNSDFHLNLRFYFYLFMYASLEVLTEVLLKIQFLWDATLYRWCIVLVIQGQAA
jgi:hypothetical protein